MAFAQEGGPEVPFADAETERKLGIPQGGQILMPGQHGDFGQLVTALLASQRDMLAEMADKIQPELHSAVTGLANMMMLAQQQARREGGGGG